VIHMLLNFAWAPLFFVFHSPVGSFIDIIFMCITLLLVFYEWKKRSPLAVYTLIPYSLWILFATYLNYTILVLN
jgi:tryptophan-rich sensory protein